MFVVASLHSPSNCVLPLYSFLHHQQHALLLLAKPTSTCIPAGGSSHLNLRLRELGEEVISDPSRAFHKQSQSAEQPARDLDQALVKVPRLPYELRYHIIGFLVPPDPPQSWFVPLDGDTELLWCDIASGLNLHLSSQKTLSVLCRVSKFMTHIARRFLYQKILLGSAEALEMLYGTVRQNPALRRRIERLFCFFDEHNTHSVVDPYTLIPQVLSILSVSDLHIPAGIFEKWDWTRQAPSGTFNPGLIKHLRLRCTTTDFPFPLAWLSRFPALETLIVAQPDCYHKVDNDKDYEFPKLKHLDLYDAAIPEDKLARIVLACPSLERLVVHFANHGFPCEDFGPSLDEALRARAPTLRHLELRAPELAGHHVDQDPDLSPAVGGCIPELTNLQELVIDLPSLFGSNPHLYASDRKYLERLPSSLCRLEIMCQWRYGWLAHDHRQRYRGGWDDDADGVSSRFDERLEAWPAAILLYWLHVIHDVLQCLPPPKDGRPFQLTLSLPGPWDQSNRGWRKDYDALMTVAAGYFGDSNTVEFRAERLLQYLDNGRSRSEEWGEDGQKDSHIAWPEGSLLPYCRTTHKQRLSARALLGMRQVNVPKPACPSNSAA